MSDLEMNHKNSIRKTAIASGIALALGSALMISEPASADILEFDWDGLFIIADPNGSILANTSITTKGANQFQTPINGTFTFDTDTGAGTGTVDPFQFFGGAPSLPATAKDFNVQSIGGGQVLGNALFDWNGNYNIPVSLVWDATGLFNNLNGLVDGFLGGCTGSSCTVSGTGATPATDGTYINATYGYLSNGPAPLATTTFNTTNAAGCIPGDCGSVNPSGTLPLITDITPFGAGVYHSTRTTGIGGNPMQSGPFEGFNANFDPQSLTVTSYQDTTPPVVTITPESININVGDAFDPLNPPGVVITVIDAVDGTLNLATDCVINNGVNNAAPGNYTVTYDCTDSTGNSNSDNPPLPTLSVTVVAVGAPVITLQGNNPVTHEAATTYVDPGATCVDADSTPILEGPNFSLDTSTLDVDVLSPPEQQVTWNCTGAAGTTSVPRGVDIQDTTPPVITLDPNCDADITVIGGPDTPDPTPTATAIDPNYDTDLTADITEAGGPVDSNPNFGQTLSEITNLSWEVSDNAANNTIETCQVTVGNPDPVATLNGDASIVISSGSEYVEEGATCEDFTDGALDDAVADSIIDESTPSGNYTITYTCGPNSLDNIGTTTRKVIIGVAFSAASDSGSTFVMIDPSNSFVGGADDVFFSWDGSLYTDPVTQTEANIFMNSAEPQPFFGFPWDAHDIRAFGPGDYVIPTSRGNTLNLHIEPNQIGAHMLFDWNNNDDIDVVLTWDINGVFVGSAGATDDLGSKGQPFGLAVIDADGDGISGTPMADGPFAGFNANFNIKLTPLFALPDTTATAAQDANDPITVISSAGGTVTVSSTVNPDVNGVFSYGTQGFSYDWGMSDAALLAANSNGTSSDTFEFNPAGLAEGATSAVAKVIDNATGVTSTVVVPLQVTAGAADGDADADGIPDSQDANDNNANPTLQQAESGNGATFLMESSAGTLIIGDAASGAGVQSGTYQAAITAADIQVTDGFVANSCVGGCFSFKVTGLNKGAAVDVVLPLSLGLPSDSRIRKFMSQGDPDVPGTWRDFDISGNDAIMYAAGSAGDCPGVNDAGWSDTPAAGDFCMKLTVVDGGPNDADSNANGTVADPVGVGGGQGAEGGPVAPPKNTGSPSTGGCSLADAGITVDKRADWWLIAGVLVALGITRRRRQKLH